jgi:hypothetical protein
MSKSFLAAKAALLLAPLLALSATVPSTAAGSLPLLSGTYLVTVNTLCQPTVTVNVSGGVIAQDAIGPGSNSLEAGTIAFAQGSTAGAGTARVTLTNDAGSPYLQAGNESGVEDAPMNQNAGGESFTFTQTATTMSFTRSGVTNTYNIYYGPVGATGIAANAVFAGIDSNHCGNNGTAIRK